ncbi:protein phosphatase 1M isoform X1 [Vulpes vulpes]|uniref:Protein phosphatase 1M isoform X1 n=1 Tax=Vulpes vulpes TaxID=9627 RepID=A0A3Q7RK06_VULVU|nr:protein phosphatase 1M isoform X1 [Vulpes vulpes]
MCKGPEVEGELGQRGTSQLLINFKLHTQPFSLFWQQPCCYWPINIMYVSSRPSSRSELWLEAFGDHEFLCSTSHEHCGRPCCVPREDVLTGGAVVWEDVSEVGSSLSGIINAEKSEFNEDQAACGQLCIRRCEFGAEEDQEWLTLCAEEFLTGHYWALFDGHGGPAAAILAANTLHSCLRRQLEAVVEGMVALQPPMHLSGRCVCPSDPQFVEEKGIRAEDLVIGALENAFQECDEVIGRELEASGQVGGCTALVAVFLQGKLYVANAGDSRAILVRKDEVRPLSSEFTPETERQRIQQLAFVYPELLAGEFTRLEFPRRLKGDDLGQKVLFRDHHMRGWSYKCVEKSDLKYPLIHGQGRQARLLGTLAVSRGLGDHQLRVLDTNIQLKPFLLSVPQVTVLDVDQLELQEEDVVVMATDGLWDVLSNEQVARLVRSFLPGNQEDPHRFSELAKMLIHSTQGKDDGPTGEGQVSYDDISVFVIPLHSQGQRSSGH